MPISCAQPFTIVRSWRPYPPHRNHCIDIKHHGTSVTQSFC